MPCDSRLIPERDDELLKGFERCFGFNHARQAVEPPGTERRFAKSKKQMKTGFDIYVTDIETGEEYFALTVYAFTSREAISIARKRLHGSKLLGKITHAAFSAVEVKD